MSVQCTLISVNRCVIIQMEAISAPVLRDICSVVIAECAMVNLVLAHPACYSPEMELVLVLLDNSSYAK